MAVFHYKLRLLPRAHFGLQFPQVLAGEQIDFGEEDNTGWWALHPPSAKLLAELRALLPLDKSWPGGQVEEYTTSPEYGSDIRIWKTGSEVHAITFRFSVVTDKWLLMQRFLEIARNGDCLLREDETGRVFEPDEQAVKERFVVSRAMRYCRDPEGTVMQAATKLREEEGSSNEQN